MPPDPIAKLVNRAQKGDVRAFEQLIDAHMSQVRRFAQAFAHDDIDAADLAQEALVKVFRSISTYRFQSAFSTWLYAIVRNVFLDYARSRATRERALEQPLDIGQVDRKKVADFHDHGRADTQIEREEERRRVWTALADVQPEFRATLVLFDIEGLTYDEVAAIEQVPLGTVKSRLSRGREQLRQILGAAEVLPRAGRTPEPTTGNIGPGPFVTTKRTRSV